MRCLILLLLVHLGVWSSFAQSADVKSYVKVDRDFIEEEGKILSHLYFFTDRKLESINFYQEVRQDTWTPTPGEYFKKYLKQDYSQLNTDQVSYKTKGVYEIRSQRVMIVFCYNENDCHSQIWNLSADQNIDTKLTDKQTVIVPMEDFQPTPNLERAQDNVQTEQTEQVGATPSELAEIKEVNFARTRPREYAQQLQKDIADGLVQDFEMDDYLKSIEYLQNTNARRNLKVDKELLLEAREWSKELVQLGELQHSDIFNGPAHGENVSFGYNTARGTVIGYIGETYNISETSPLGHRENIFNDSFRSIGVGITGLYSVQQFKF